MNRFEYSRAQDVAAAVRERAAVAGAKFIAGGTNLVDLMKENVTRPERLIDITRLPLREIRELEGGGLRLGALATNAETAYHSLVQERFPLLSSAILAGASAQLRNAATNGGNLLQRTRCYYFYDTATPCNKRQPGSGCPAKRGVNRIHAILGTSEHCIATHPSDMAVALAALDATVQVTGSEGERSLPIAELHRLPGDQPQRDTTLADDELVTAIDLPANRFGQHHTYLKLRDRLSYAFALVSVAAGLELEDGVVRRARIALGGVAHKPWRRPEAEAALEGRPADEESFRKAAEILLEGARGFGGNDFKIGMVRAAVPRALAQAAAGTPQSQTDKRVK